MGCCSSTARSRRVEINRYRGFHEESPPPTNACDEKLKDCVGEFATFGCGGDFRAAQARFSLIPGVIRTRVGFSGGKAFLAEGKIDKIHDHTEVVDIEYDPYLIAYEKLLDVFWTTHEPTKERPTLFNYGPADRRLFQESEKKNEEGKNRTFSKIFYHSKAQKKSAEEAIMNRDRALHSHKEVVMKRIRTDLEPAKHIFLANNEDQQYYLQQDDFLLIVANCQTAEGLVYSHMASRLNGLCSEFATLQDVDTAKHEIELGLSDEVLDYLKQKILSRANADTEK